jgi:hypothetical protein
MPVRSRILQRLRVTIAVRFASLFDEADEVTNVDIMRTSDRLAHRGTSAVHWCPIL